VLFIAFLTLPLYNEFKPRRFTSVAKDVSNYAERSGRTGSRYHRVFVNPHSSYSNHLDHLDAARTCDNNLDSRVLKWYLMDKSGVGRSVEHPRPAYRLYRWAWAGLDMVYPPHCSGCGKPGSRWCEACQSEMHWVLPPFCDCCGKSNSHPGLCAACQAELPPYAAVRSVAVFDGALREALHRLKYAGDIPLAEALACHLIELYRRQPWEVDLVVPVPSGVTHRAQRGYNQAALLAWPLALACNLSYRPNALNKARETRSQVGLNFAERHENIAGAFQADPRIVTGKSVMIVDDITTSGATLHNCAASLLSSGCERVYGLTLARTAYEALDR
jgi:competence protein ComFC